MNGVVLRYEPKKSKPFCIYEIFYNELWDDKATFMFIDSFENQVQAIKVLMELSEDEYDR